MGRARAFHCRFVCCVFCKRSFVFINGLTCDICNKIASQDNCRERVHAVDNVRAREVVAAVFCTSVTFGEGMLPMVSIFGCFELSGNPAGSELLAHPKLRLVIDCRTLRVSSSNLNTLGVVNSQ